MCVTACVLQVFLTKYKHGYRLGPMACWAVLLANLYSTDGMWIRALVWNNHTISKVSRQVVSLLELTTSARKQKTGKTMQIWDTHNDFVVITIAMQHNVQDKTTENVNTVTNFSPLAFSILAWKAVSERRTGCCRLPGSKGPRIESDLWGTSCGSCHSPGLASGYQVTRDQMRRPGGKNIDFVN